MNAKWLASTTDKGIKLTYHNLVDNVVFECGTTDASGSLHDFLDFALNEGAEPGDCFYLDGKLVCEIILNGELYERQETYRN